MRLVRFKVTNFRSVVDSGWIGAERVTALVGVNESGKTNLLLPLWKLNPAREGEIKPTSDYPKSNYAAIKENPAAFRFICAEFSCECIAMELAALTHFSAGELDTVQVFRDFSGAVGVTFPKCQIVREADGAEVSTLIGDTETEMNTMSALAKEAAVKRDLLEALAVAQEASRQEGGLRAGRMSTWVAQMATAAPETPAPTSSIVPRYNRLVQALEAIIRKIGAAPPEEAAGVVERLTRNQSATNFLSRVNGLALDRTAFAFLAIAG